MDTVKLRTLVKPLVRGVLLKVHPDYFVHDPVAKRINQASVQRLQDLLAPVLKDPSEKHNRSGPVDTPLEFFSKSSDATQNPISFAFSKIHQSATGAPHRHQHQHHEQQHQQLVAQRTRDLVALCGELSVPTSTEALAEIEKTIGPSLAAAAASAPVSAGELRAARAREALENYARRSAAPDLHAALLDRLRQASWSPDDAQRSKSARLELDRSKVFFASSVNPQRYAGVVERIEAELHNLHYDRWCSLPLMIVNDWRHAFRGSASRYPGFVVMPIKVSIQEFNRYILQSLSDITQARSERNSQGQ
ncbi:hypothetical protein LPJ66_006191 [Kickxella alabastrina]|uniref:Uncharacterized protein n=1 Tax=Kickxella alabastrina TaxID=61397 RepID=A0ACC1IES3_9FUNG|nr:hypothetical protein LPJ66_006191 [Kickxella alabastrina]